MQILYDEPMAAHTTMRVGGPADRMAVVQTEEELRETLISCTRQGIPCTVIGKGSNLLVGDAGYRGTVILTAGSLNGTEVVREETDTVLIGAKSGVVLMALSVFAAEQGLSGLEFASGIPGTVGGAVRMNAGAYGGEMRDVTAEVTLLGRDGTVRSVSGEEMRFSYRHSVLMETGEIVLSARFRLRRGDRTEIRRTMDELLEKRRSKQPLEYPSAGSTWKRPEGYFAAKLIEEAGCKGLSVGDAQISEKHAGFLINKGHATAAQIRSLMREVERRVYESSGVRLTPEVELLGEWEEETES